MSDAVTGPEPASGSEPGRLSAPHRESLIHGRGAGQRGDPPPDLPAQVSSSAELPVPELRATYGTWFTLFESLSIAVFSVEYFARLWNAGARQDGGFRARLRWSRSPMALVDLFAVLPYWLPFIGIDLRALRLVRLARVFRILKLGRYSVALQTFARVLVSKRFELIAAGGIGLATLFLAATLMYLVENIAQPDVFLSIPASMWWAVTTLTTVGYGDTYPMTPIGRFLGAIVAIIGIGMFALPTGILGSAFVEELHPGQRESVCPHCGGALRDERPKEP